jgi:hypothetical protein
MSWNKSSSRAGYREPSEAGAPPPLDPETPVPFTSGLRDYIWSATIIGLIIGAMAFIVTWIIYAKVYGQHDTLTCNLVDLALQGVCSNTTYTEYVPAQLCKQGFRALVTISAFTCNGTAGGTSTRTAPLFVYLPNNFQSNTSYGSLAGTCPGITGSCYIGTIPPAGGDTNDPFISTVVPFLTSGAYAYSTATVRTIHSATTGVAQTLVDMGLTASNTGMAASASMGPALSAITLEYQSNTFG